MRLTVTGGYGTLLATVGVGGLLGALLVAGPISHAANKGRILMTAGLAFATLLLGFAYTPDGADDGVAVCAQVLGFLATRVREKLFFASFAIIALNLECFRRGKVVGQQTA